MGEHRASQHRDPDRRDASSRTGGHRTSQRSVRISRGPIIAVVSVLVLVLAVFGWFELRNQISSEGSVAAEACVEGSAVVHIAADPEIEPVIADLARAYGDTRPVVRDHCISLDVRSIASADVGGALSNNTWNPALGDQPALWIPQSSVSILDLARADIVDGTPKSLATSPVVLAVPTQVQKPLAAADIGWKDLARLQADPTSLERIGLTGWGALRIVFPMGAPSGSTSLALNAIASATQNLGPNSLDLAGASTTATWDVTSALAVLRTADNSSSSAADDRSTSDAMAALREATSPADPVHAVPATEQALLTSRSAGLSAFYPAGPTPVMDYPAAILSGSWVDATQSLAAAQFVEFVRQQAQVETLAAAGFRAGTAVPQATSTVAVPVLDRTMNPMIGGVPALLRDQLAHPAQPLRTTVLLDTSSSMAVTDGPATRLQNSVAALSRLTDAVSSKSDAGLWVYSRNLDGDSPFRVAVPTMPLTDAQRSTVTSTLTTLRAGGDTYTYVSVLAAYIDAVAKYSVGQPNSVLLITGGGDDDPGVPGRQLLDAIGRAVDPARPVSLDVISIGSTADVATLQAAASRTGGTFASVTSSDTPEFAAALAAAFGSS